MIQIGSTTINVISIGSTTPTKIDWGSDKVWPYGSTDPYVLSGLTTSPMRIEKDQTNFTISIVSKQGETATAQPTVSIGYHPEMNVQMIMAVAGGTQGQWNYGFSCNANNNLSQRSISITFTQPGSNKTLTYHIVQSG